MHCRWQVLLVWWVREGWTNAGLVVGAVRVPTGQLQVQYTPWCLAVLQQ